MSFGHYNMYHSDAGNNLFCYLYLCHNYKHFLIQVMYMYLQTTYHDILNWTWHASVGNNQSLFILNSAEIAVWQVGMRVSYKYCGYWSQWFHCKNYLPEIDDGRMIWAVISFVISVRLPISDIYILYTTKKHLKYQKKNKDWKKQFKHVI